MRQVFDHYPEVSRTVYLVDEEFIGQGENAIPRALRIADVLASAGFSWETSCRVDQRSCAWIGTEPGASSAATCGGAWSSGDYGVACSGWSPG